MPSAAAQTAGGAAGPAEPRAVFALPWEIDFARIRTAMVGRSYELEQTRRVLGRRAGADTIWLGVRERVRYAAATAEREARFDLELLGVEGPPVDPAAADLRAALFEARADFLFHYHGFRVSDPARAARHYQIVFLGVQVRLDRPVYRVAVMPVAEGRSRWLVDLDVETGYPLYRARYGSDGERLMEIRVTRFDAGYDGSALVSDERPGVQTAADAPAALRLAGLPPSCQPRREVLPAGYALDAASVVTGLFSGAKTVQLVYSDGIDHLFVIVAADPRQALGPGHVIAVYRDVTGMEQCMFVHRGVQYLVIGHEANGFAQPLAKALYAQAVR